ncbi:MAG: diacylglycerol kinase family protein [Tepidisphaeraceae bacterium]
MRSLGPFLRSFVYAGRGVVEMFRTQRNPRVQAALMLVAVVLGIVLKIDRIEWAIFALASALVLALEGANTAIEAVTDLASPEQHPLARRAKDCAAGAVLLAAIGAAIVGLFIFGPKLLRLFAP